MSRIALDISNDTIENVVHMFSEDLIFKFKPAGSPKKGGDNTNERKADYMLRARNLASPYRLVSQV